MHPEKVHCAECSPGFGLKHEAEECDSVLNCENTCVPCEVKGCMQCSTLASACIECERKLQLHEGKCTGTASDHHWDWIPAVSEAQVTTQVNEVNPALENPMVPFQSLGVMSMAIASVLYLVLVFGVGFCYMQCKGQRLTAASGYLPEDGFSDAICECGQSWPICIWACFCPCIRWSDTISQMRFMSFYLCLLIWCSLMLCNALLTGLGFVFVVLLGAWQRNRMRGYFGLPRNCMTGVQDVIAWLCCQPCAIAQEARHAERALGLQTNSQR
jgi:Cys-rich protein (TIGR01571 family)